MNNARCIQLGDSGHVHGLSLVVTLAEGFAIAADRSGKEWMLMPLHSAPGQYALSGMGTRSRIRGRVTVTDGTLHEAAQP